MTSKTILQNFFILGKFLTYPTKELPDEILILLKNMEENKYKKNYMELYEILKKEIRNEELEAEYTSLFITGYPKTPCPPYYSVYKTGLMVSKHTEDLYNIYEKYGIELSNEQFPDFIPTMIEFLTLLLSNNMEEEAKKFHNEYLSWLTEFADNIKRNTKSLYFIKTATNLKNFISEVNELWKK